MKLHSTRIVLLLAAAVALLPVVSGCYAHATARVPTVRASLVYHRPPPGLVVVRPPAPRVHAVWVEGHWQWAANRWNWRPGYWVTARPGYAYVQPRWVRYGEGWRLRTGYWVRGQVNVTPRQSVYRRPPAYRRQYRHRYEYR